MRWNKVTLIGVGLLGGSLGQALRERHLARQVVGLVRRETSIAECRQAGAVDVATLDLAEAVTEADLIVLGTPLGQMESLARAMLPHLRSQALITDVGSVKAPLVACLEPLYAAAGARFVGSHPMAGSERTGVAHARADLFERAICVVTPTERSEPAAVGEVEELWRSVGGVVRLMTAARHDELVSRSSHLPYLMAVSLVDVALGAAGEAGQEALCATGFRDGTRVASGSPEMWRDIAAMNRLPIGAALDAMAARIAKLKSMLERADLAELDRFLCETRELRETWLTAFERDSEPPAPGD